MQTETSNETAANADGENKVQVSVFVSPDIKAKLESAAQRNYRSASREAAFRIAQSFASETI